MTFYKPQSDISSKCTNFRKKSATCSNNARVSFPTPYSRSVRFLDEPIVQTGLPKTNPRKRCTDTEQARIHGDTQARMYATYARFMESKVAHLKKIIIFLINHFWTTHRQTSGWSARDKDIPECDRWGRVTTRDVGF